LRKPGLDYEQIKDRCPRLVYGIVLGYGEEGPERDRPAFDYTTFYARSGIMGDLAVKDHPPLNPIPGLGDHTTGGFLAGGICAALFARTATGKGDRVTAGLYQAGLYGMGCGVVMAEHGRPFPRDREDSNTPVSCAYKCKDGEWFYVAAGSYDQQWPRICRDVLGHPELAEDPRFKDVKATVKNVYAGVGILDEIFIQEDLAYWDDKLNKADIPHERLAHLKDIPNDEQAWANRYLHEVHYPDGGKVAYPATPVDMDSVGEKEFNVSRPLGADTRAVLEGLGYTAEELDAMYASGAVK
ncbi:MAG: CaiB/BaiF CoA transferase family protein, partial [Oscillospiraceae bacterium]